MISRRALRSLTPAMLVTATRCLSASAPSAATARFGAASPASVPVPPETLAAIDGLEPSPLWAHFAALSSIPRPSKREDAVLSYVKDVAESCGLRWTADRVGNLCVFRPGSGGGEDAPPVILQGHVDMVTEKNEGTDHDFERDPVRLRRFVDVADEGGSPSTWIGARGTTLGADNGIGVAAALTLLCAPAEDPRRKPLPPIEALFTVDEETGLTGAMALDAEALGLTGRTMLNLDTEEWGDLYVGCAGGGETEIELPLKRAAVDDGRRRCSLVELRVEGLMGGHSGINIHEGRANAVLLCAAAARAALDRSDGDGDGGASLVSIRGGDKHNAIPREASAILSVEPSVRPAVEAAVAACERAALAEYGTLEVGLRMGLADVEEASVPPLIDPLDGPSADRLLAALLALPVGPLKYSHVLPDLVETSNNLASVSTDDGTATMLCSTRSSIDAALESARDRIQAVATLAGATVRRSGRYPGWTPDPNSAVLGVAKELLRRRLGGKEPGIRAIHAGLECGLLLEKLGRGEKGDVVDALSFGPTIRGAHSPDERVDAETVAPFFELVEDILAELAMKRA